MKKILLLLTILFQSALFAQTWEAKTGLEQNTRHHPVTWGIDGYGYAVTGTTQTNNITDDVFKYDPVSDSWEQLQDFPGQARSFAIGDSYDGIGYLGFGSSTTHYLNDLWKYNTETNTWTKLASCPCSGRQHPSFTINQEHGKIYVGEGNNNNNLGDWWEYDIASNTWQQRTDFPGTPRHHPYQFSIDGVSYSGFGDDHGATYAREDFYKFDTNLNTWTEVAEAPDGIGRIAGTQFEYNGYGFVLDGDSAYHSSTNPSIFWRYNPGQNTWDELIPHPGRSTWAPGSFILEGRLYMLGGMIRVNQNNQTFFEGMWSTDLTDGLSVDSVDTSKFAVYPNPTHNDVFISSTDNTSIKSYTLYNTLGRVVKTGTLKNSKISLNELSPGIYFLKLKTNEKDLVNKKIIKL